MEENRKMTSTQKLALIGMAFLGSVGGCVMSWPSMGNEIKERETSPETERSSTFPYSHITLPTTSTPYVGSPNDLRDVMLEGTVQKSTPYENGQIVEGIDSNGNLFYLIIEGDCPLYRAGEEISRWANIDGNSYVSDCE